MVLIEWREEFNTGVSEVDHEHREIVDLINELHAAIGKDASRESAGRFLGEVFAKISAHFALEETVMRKHNYDEYADHKSDHEKLLDDLRDIMDDVEEGAGGDYETALAESVRDWFVNHFKTKDARLHKKLGV
ncbi:MAG TPA: bacteriohemerythrin [Rhizobiales bacterium]|nr:bacteriohemerythrin [bacterium BMS3Bbin10]HDO51785.1 bacteriohemerythrin [Hyphomicrobiales bacterium]